jgi:hypothetical protein
VSESRGDRAANPNGINVDYVVFHVIINAEWESLRQHPMEFKVDWMNTGKKN